MARLGEPPRRLIVLAGPRQTGKTTLVEAALSKVSCPTRYEPVDEPREPGLALMPPPGTQSTTRRMTAYPGDRGWIADVWREARRDAAESPQGTVLVFDEIQKIQNWQETVKGLWDVDRRTGTPLHVVLLGSAPLLMREGLTESLAGRFETIRLSHWSYTEMSTAFGLDLPRYVYFGGYPGGSDLLQAEDRWRDYVATALVEPNIERDILALVRVDKPALLKRLFRLSCEFSGEVLSYQKMVGQLADAGNATTLARYLDLLENAGLVAGLPKYEGRTRRLDRSSPKLIVLNTALMSSHSGYRFSEAQADRTFWGRLVETAVGAHLYNTGSPATRLYYWRERDVEVDFVLERGRRVVGVEVKSNGHGTNARGRAAFEARFDAEPCIVVGGDGVPLADFLSSPADRWFEELA